MLRCTWIAAYEEEDTCTKAAVHTDCCCAHAAAIGARKVLSAAPFLPLAKKGAAPCQERHTHRMSCGAAKAEAILGADQDDDIYTQIEKERAELRKQGGLTPVTHDSFVAWKDRKAKERQMAEVDKAREMLKVPASVCVSVRLSLSPGVSLSVCLCESTLRVSGSRA